VRIPTGLAGRERTVVVGGEVVAAAGATGEEAAEGEAARTPGGRGRRLRGLRGDRGEVRRGVLPAGGSLTGGSCRAEPATEGGSEPFDSDDERGGRGGGAPDIGKDTRREVTHDAIEEYGAEGLRERLEEVEWSRTTEEFGVEYSVCIVSVLT